MPAPVTEEQIVEKVFRAKAFWSALTQFTAWASGAALISAIGFLIFWKMHTEPKLEVDYIKAIYGADRMGVPKPNGKYAGPRQPLDDNAADGGKGTPSNPDPGPAVTPVTEVSVPPNAGYQVSPEVPSEIEDLDDKRAEIGRVVEEFFAVQSLTELLPLVRDARRIRPLMEQYYARLPFERPVWKSMGTLIPVKEPGFRLAFAEAIFENCPPTHVVVQESDVGFFIDWESAVCYSEVRWTDFLRDFLSKHTAKPTLFRLLASKPDPDKAPGSDDARQSIVLQLSHPREEGIAYATFNSGDPSMRPLLDQLTACNWQNAPVIVRLAFGAAPGETMRITSVEGKGWLILNRAKPIVSKKSIASIPTAHAGPPERPGMTSTSKDYER